ncbi:MAG: AbgT family transporter [Gammaproteobacteria bacterium]|nr:AbgT family transporter [Gammaproteobacteria bacterium]
MSFLDRIERLGNRLPEPATLFFIGTIIVMLCSAFAARSNWSMQAPADDRELTVNNLLNSDGLWWFISHLVENFITFPPLAIVLVGMLGIGLAERSGLLPALFRQLAQLTPAALLTPAMVFLGIQSSMALDAGYVVLPPLAAALYLAAGRSPLAGIAAVFAGVSAGFSANFFITALDPLLAGFTQSGASLIAPDYRVAVTANWWFMIVSTVLLTGIGWMVTAWYVEPRLQGAEYVDNSETEGPDNDDISQSEERRGLARAGIALTVTIVLIVFATFYPGAPLYGKGEHFSRWVEVTVPLLFICFFIPGMVYGICTRSIRSDRDLATMLYKTVAGLGPYIVLAFFAAQFVEAFRYSGLGEMLAVSGGSLLSSMAVPSPLLMSGFILLVGLANLLIGSASAKYAFFAPIFVPMFMQAGISPELTQVAYRIGDSFSNIITPLNPYMIIIIALVQRYSRGAGFGTVLALMLPYSIAFLITWIILLAGWLLLGAPLGPGGPLSFSI